MTTTTPPSGSPDGTAALVADIERRRAELTDTVEALSAKLDVKTRAVSGSKALAESARRMVREKPAVVAGSAAGIIAFVAFMRKVRNR